MADPVEIGRVTATLDAILAGPDVNIRAGEALAAGQAPEIAELVYGTLADYLLDPTRGNDIQAAEALAKRAPKPGQQKVYAALADYFERQVNQTSFKQLKQKLGYGTKALNYRDLSKAK